MELDELRHRSIDHCPQESCIITNLGHHRSLLLGFLARLLLVSGDGLMVCNVHLKMGMYIWLSVNFVSGPKVTFEALQ